MNKLIITTLALTLAGAAGAAQAHSERDQSHGAVATVQAKVGDRGKVADVNVNVGGNQNSRGNDKGLIDVKANVLSSGKSGGLLDVKANVLDSRQGGLLGLNIGLLNSGSGKKGH